MSLCLRAWQLCSESVGHEMNTVRRRHATNKRVFDQLEEPANASEQKVSTFSSPLKKLSPENSHSCSSGKSASHDRTGCHQTPQTSDTSLSEQKGSCHDRTGRRPNQPDSNSWSPMKKNSFTRRTWGHQTTAEVLCNARPPSR